MLTEKYRPKNLRDIVGQDNIINQLFNLIQSNKKVNMLFLGPPGCGKTTTAYAYANEINFPVVEFNASDERGLQTIREKIKRLAFTSGERIILLDEADNLTSDAQHALRRIMERASENVIFILTGNEEWRIIDPIKSRCAIFRFKKLDEKSVAQVLFKILKEEQIKITQEISGSLIKLIKITNGDLRKMLNQLETIISKSGTITPESIELLIKPNLTLQSLESLLNFGDFEQSLRTLEDALIISQLNYKEIIQAIFKSIDKLNVKFMTKMKIYDRLSRAEHAIQIGCDPLIQLAGFLADVWAFEYTRRDKS